MKKSKKQEQNENSNELQLKNEIIGLILLFLAIFFIFSLFSYTPTDPSFFNSSPGQGVVNYGGRLGAQVGALMFNLFGYSSYILLFYMLFMTSFYLVNKKIRNVMTKSFGYLMLLIFSASFFAGIKPLASISGTKVKSGGIIGFLINDLGQYHLKQTFAALLFFIFMMIGLILIAKFSMRKIFGFLFSSFEKRFAGFVERMKQRSEERAKIRSMKRIQNKYNIDPKLEFKKIEKEVDEDDDKIFGSSDSIFGRVEKNETDQGYKYEKSDSQEKYIKFDKFEGNDFPDHSQSGHSDHIEPEEADENEPKIFKSDSFAPEDFANTNPAANIVEEGPFSDSNDEDEDEEEGSLFNIKRPAREITPAPVPKKVPVRQPSRLPEETSLFADFQPKTTDKTKYQAPPLSYLDAPTEKSKIDYKELEIKKEELKQRMIEFRIRGDIVEYTPGPVITTYEFVPDTGVKVKDVTNLSEDIALVAKAQYVRIERILGKKAIGIEIPNKKREIIHLREILESEDYQNSRSPLTIGIGKTKSGEIFISDLREMPHLIIAGATGSGKSVAIHSVLLSILYKASPDEVKLVLIDPKRVEMALYNTLPHLLTPVVVNTKLAKNALEWAVFEMENRYKKLALLQARNLDQYNKKIEMMHQTEDEGLDKLEEAEKIPYIVIVIDEFADLMMESQREIETAVARIAQKARAVGIHLILATQRPSIDVITGTIKNNFPSRIALAVPSKHDSRTIIDVMGAEKLLGNGDMLFLPPKTASLVRLHCAYVSEEEILRVVNYLSKMGRPKFNTQVVKPMSEEGGGEGDEDLDELFYEAAEVVVSTGQASASYLQRKMSIGYARAGRLIDQLQSQGVVSSSDNKNRREILMTLDELNLMQSGNKPARQANNENNENGNKEIF